MVKLFKTRLLSEAAKKVLLLMARPLRHNPPPSSLMATLEERWKKRIPKEKLTKKISGFLLVELKKRREDNPPEALGKNIFLHQRKENMNPKVGKGRP